MVSSTITQLVDHIRRVEHSLFSGEFILSLTPSIISSISTSANQQHVTPNQRLDVHSSHDDVQYLRFACQRTLFLRISSIGVTIQGTIPVDLFRSLRYLELRKFPLHMLRGLSYLRGQLECVICFGSVTSLENLLRKCGGDGSHSFHWQRLKTLVCTGAGLEELDDSISLAPALQNLDLSKNLLVSCENFRGTLEELECLNLNHNRLATVPTVSTFTRSRLRILSLKDNRLESIDGIEDLENLRDLDISDNCIADYKLLWPLRHLSRLNQLRLTGNPISFDPNHRTLTVQFIHPRAAKENRFHLDGIVLSPAEVLAIPQEAPAPLPRSVSADDVISVSLESVPEIGETSQVDSSLFSSAARRKVVRTRVVKLDDSAESDAQRERASPVLNASSNTPLTQSTSLAREIVSLQEQFGEEWLKFQTAKDSTNNRQSIEAISSAEPISEPIIPDITAELNLVPPEDIFPRSESTEPPLPTETDENESDPFLVQMEGTLEPEDALLITVGDIHIIERNISAVIIEKLEINSIQKVSHQADSSEVTLYFDYVRKDRRKRVYVFENAEHAVEFLALVQPFIDTRSDNTVLYRCLKCGEIFSEYQADKVIKYVSKTDPTKVFSTSIGSASASFKGELTELMTCPACASEMLVRQEDAPVSGSHSEGILNGRQKSSSMRRSNSVVILNDEPSEMDETIIPASFRSPPMFGSPPIGFGIENGEQSLDHTMIRRDSTEETLYSVKSVDEALEQLRRVQKPVSTTDVQWNYEEYGMIDHRLRLHLDMSMLSNAGEVLQLVARTDLYTGDMMEAVDTVLIVSNLFVYKETPNIDDAGDFITTLNGSDYVPLKDINLVHQICEGECLRISFGSRDPWLLLFRDQKRCGRFVQQLEDVLTMNKVAFETKATDEAIELEAWLSSVDFDHEDSEPSVAVSLRTMCFIGRASVTLLFTETHVIIAKDDWKSLCGSGKSSLTLVDAKPISAISSLVVFLSKPTELALKFFEDTENIDQWDFRLQTLEAMERVVAATRDPWENRIFHVPLSAEVHF